MPTQCELSSLSKGTWEVKCRKLAESSLVSGLLSSKSLVDADPPRTDEEDQRTEEEPEVMISSSSLVYWLELYDAETGQLLRNVSHAVPRFSVAGIDPGTRVAAVVTSANRQGRSEPVRLEGAVERAVGSRAGQFTSPPCHFCRSKSGRCLCTLVFHANCNLLERTRFCT